MAGSNACVSSQYFSGQGAFLLADRDGSGNPLGFRPVGNVSALTLSIETTEFEHTESCTGARAIDLVIVQEINATLTVTMECLFRENLALALFGSSSAIAAGSVANEAVVARHDLWVSLANIDVSSVVVTDVGGATTYTEGSDYLCNEKAGSIFVLSTGLIADAQNLEIDYDFAAQDDVQAVLTSTGAIKYARFEGLNTALDPNSSAVVDIFKAQVQPLAELALINDEIAQMEVEFQILSDPLQATDSKFFTIRKSDGG
jgi:hypothetical protein